MLAATVIAAAPVSGVHAAALALVAPGDGSLSNADITVEVGQLFTLELWAIDFPANVATLPIQGLSSTDQTVVWNRGYGTTGPGISNVEGWFYGDPANQPVAAGNFLIATWNFEALATGTSSLAPLLSSSTALSFVVDPTVEPFFYTYQCLGDAATQSCGGDFIGTVSTGIASVTVVAPSAVPIPPAIWLLGSAMAGLLGIVRRRRQPV